MITILFFFTSSSSSNSRNFNKMSIINSNNKNQHQITFSQNKLESFKTRKVSVAILSQQKLKTIQTVICDYPASYLHQVDQTHATNYYSYSGYHSRCVIPYPLQKILSLRLNFLVIIGFKCSQSENSSFGWLPVTW